jgi:hypothetical protein
VLALSTTIVRESGQPHAAIVSSTLSSVALLLWVMTATVRSAGKSALIVTKASSA